MEMSTFPLWLNVYDNEKVKSMFLCKNCLEKNYLVETPRGLEPWTEDSWVGLPASYGPCEDCRKVHPCYDIHSSRLMHKDSDYAKLYLNPNFVTITGVDRIIASGSKKVTYTRDEHNFFSINGENGELLTYFPIMDGKQGYRVIFSDFGDLDNFRGEEGTFKDEDKAAEMFYRILRKLCA